MPTDQPLDRRRSLRRSLVVVVALTVVAAACGGKSADNSGKASRALTSDTVESGLAEAGKPVRGGKLVYGLEAETAGGFCLPEGQLAISGMMVVRAIYDTLTVPEQQGRVRAVPGQERSPTTPTTRRGTITVRGGVTFHDGTQARRPGREEQPRRLPRQVPGPQSRCCSPSSLSNIASVDAQRTDDGRGHDQGALGAFPAFLYGGSRFGIMAQAQLDDKKTCDRKLIGTGPFKFVSWQPNVALKARAQPRLLADRARRQALPLRRLDRVPADARGGAAHQLLQSGDVNVMHTSSAPTSATRSPKLRDDGKVNMLSPSTHAEARLPACSTRRSRRSTTCACARPFAMPSTARRSTTILDDGLPTVPTARSPRATSATSRTPGFPKHDLAGAKRSSTSTRRTGKAPSSRSPCRRPGGHPARRAGPAADRQGRVPVKLSRHEEQAQLINDAIGGKFQAIRSATTPATTPTPSTSGGTAARATR